MKKSLLILQLFLAIQCLHAQNLVKNPSFEELTDKVKPCTYSFGNEFNNAVKDWKNYKGVTADILNGKWFWDFSLLQRV